MSFPNSQKEENDKIHDFRADDCYKLCELYIKHQKELGYYDFNLSDDCIYQLLPSINRRKKTLYLPRIAEALFILDEIGAKDDFIYLMLAQKMLEIDDYEQCELFLEELEKRRADIKVSSNEQLSFAVILKLMFCVFHEYGHYFISDDEEVKKLIGECVDLMIKGLDVDIDNMSLITDILCSYKQTFPERNDEIEQNRSALISVFLENDIYDKSKVFSSKENTKEEYLADYFAISQLDDFFGQLGFLYNGDNVSFMAKKILESLSVANVINNISRSLDDVAGLNKGMINSLVYDASRISIAVITCGTIFSIRHDIEDFFDDDYLYHLFLDKSKYLISMKGSDYYTLINEKIMFGSVNNTRDENRIALLKNRIDEYVTALKKLYI